MNHVRPLAVVALLSLTTNALAEPLHGSGDRPDRPRRSRQDERDLARERPKVIRYDPDHPISAPPGYVYHERPNRGLMISGVVIFGTFWGFSLLIAGAASSTGSSNSGSSWLAVPLVGPFIAQQSIKQSQDCTTTSNGTFCTDSPSPASTAYIFLGASQLLGATLFGASYALPARYYYRQSAQLNIGPARIGTGYGLTAQGQF